MTPDEKQAFKIRMVEAEESVKKAISLTETTRPGQLVIEVEELKLLVYESLKASELLLEIANMSLDDSWDLKNSSIPKGATKPFKTKRNQKMSVSREDDRYSTKLYEIPFRITAFIRELEKQLKEPNESWSEEQLKEQRQIVKSALAQIEAAQKNLQPSQGSFFSRVSADHAQKLFDKEQDCLKRGKYDFEEHLRAIGAPMRNRINEAEKAEKAKEKAEAIEQREKKEMRLMVRRQIERLAYTNSLLLLARHTPQLQQLNYDATKLEQQLTEQYKEDSSQISVEALEQQIKEILMTTKPAPNLILGTCTDKFAKGYEYVELYGTLGQDLPRHIAGRPPHYQHKSSAKEKQAWRTIHQSGETVLQPQDQRDRHTYIIGKSGSGKTTLMLNMIYQDLKAGNGLGVIAPEQEMLTEQILPYIPENRIDDVIYFNPADENPIPFNPLNLDPDEDADLKADEVMTIFKRIIGTEGTPRIDEILRQSIYALLTTPNTTILDIPKLLDRADPDYRHQIISQLQDEYCAHFWRDTYPQFPKDAHLPVLYRIGAFTRDKRIRNTLCRTGQSLNFRQVMDTGKVILFNLSDGILGEQNSQLLGQLIVSQFQLAVASRANIPEQQRKRFYLYIDEFQTFTNTATSSYEKILSRARKYRLAIILAHQQTGQIPSELLRDIFGNVSTMISFTVSHKDATKFSKEFLTKQPYQLAPTPPEQFVQLEVGETYCKLGRESFKMKTPLITEQPNWDIKEKILEHSRQLFASDTATPISKPKSPEPPSQPAPDEPLFTKPKIKPTGKIK